MAIKKTKKTNSTNGTRLITISRAHDKTEMVTDLALKVEYMT